MTKDEIKLEKQRMKHERDMASSEAMKDIILGLTTNPVIEFLAGIAILEQMELKKITSLLDTKVMEAGLVGIIAAQQLGPKNTIELLKAGGEATQSLIGGLTGGLAKAGSVAALL